jgi:hypothetical protein
MSKKKKQTGVWTDRRRWLMNTLSALILLALGKGWDWFQTSPAPTGRALSLGLGGGVYTMVTSSDSVSLALSEPRSTTGIPEEPRDVV